MKKIWIDGEEYTSYGVSEDPRRIITEFCTIIMHPICDSNGVKWDEKAKASIPGDAPNIVPITFETPDLTEKYIDDVKREFEDFHNKWVDISDIEAARIMGLIRGKDPKETKSKYNKYTSSVIEENSEAINALKQKNSEMKFVEFRSTIGRENLWIRLENGCIDRESFSKFSKLEQIYGYRDSLHLWLKLSSSRMTKEDIADLIHSIHFEAQYSDPEPTVLYLKDYIDVDHTPEERKHVLSYKEKTEKENSWEDLPITERRQQEKSTLRHLMEEDKLSTKTYNCYRIYIKSGSINQTAKRMKCSNAKVTALLEECEKVLEHRIRNKRRGGRGANREPFFEDKGYSEDVISDDSVYSDSQAASQDFDYEEVERNLQ